MNYLLLIVLPTAFYILEDLLPTKGKYFRKAGILTIIILTSLRYGFGADYFTYFDTFYRIKSGIFIDAFEPGYILLNAVIAFLGLHFNFVLLVISLFNYVLLYLAIENHSTKYKWLSMFLFLVYFDLFFYSLSAIRQSIIISIFLYSSKYIELKKPFKYFAWILFGSLFHWTSIILLPIYFLYHKLKRMNFFSMSTILFVGIFSYSIIVKSIYLLEPFLNYKLRYYLLIFEAGIPSNYMFSLFVSILALFWIYISVRLKNRREILVKSERNNLHLKRNTSYSISLPEFSLLLFFSLKILQYIEYYSILPRLQMYFYPFYILAIPEVLTILDSRSRKIAILCIVVFMSVFFVLSYNEVNNYASAYYGNYNLIKFHFVE